MDARRLYQPIITLARLSSWRSRVRGIVALSKGQVVAGSFYLFANALIQALFGVVFWTIAARVYSLASVGFVAAIIAAAGLVVTLSNLGLGTVVVRYLGVSGTQARRLCIVTSVLAGIAAIAVVAGAAAFPFWPLAAQIISTVPGGLALPGLLAVAMTVAVIQDNIFTARHRTVAVFSRGLVSALVRFALLFVLVGAGANGLIIAFAAGAIVSVALGSGAWSGKPIASKADTKVIRKTPPGEMARFGVTAYVSGLFSQSPQLLYPILIASQVSHNAAGAFTFAWMAAALLMQLPPSVANVLMAQLVGNSVDAEARIRKITRVLIGAMAVMSLFVGAGVVLFTALFLPSATAEVAGYLPLLLLSSLPYTVVRMRTMDLSLHGDLRGLLKLNVVVAVLAVVLPVVALPVYGVVGLEIGWLLSQVVGILMSLMQKTRVPLSGSEAERSTSGVPTNQSKIEWIEGVAEV